MSVPRLGERVIVSDGYSRRRGKVVHFNLEHHWYMVEFEGVHVDPLTGKHSKYRECFKYVPDEMLNLATRIKEQIIAEAKENAKGVYNRRK